MKNKKILILGATGLLIIVILISIFIFKSKGESENPKEATSNSQELEDIVPEQETTSENIATQIGSYIPDKTQEEIVEILDTELTEEQIESTQSIMEEVFLPEEVEVNRQGDLVIIDENGEETPVEHPHQDIIDMTDEEAAAESERLMAEFLELTGIDLHEKYTPSSEEIEGG